MAEDTVKQVKVLVTGGGGQLGAHLVHGLSTAQPVEGVEVQVAYTYRSKDLIHIPEEAQGFRVGLAEGEDATELENCLRNFAPDLIVHSAAEARPKVCEENTDAIRAINVPTLLLKAMKAVPEISKCIVIQISTDLVYDGESAELYTEDSPTNPVNAYGQSKVDAEALFRVEWPNSVCLRSSMIFGKALTEPCGFFSHFVHGALQGDKPIDFFVDEFRSPVYAGDFVEAVLGVIRKCVVPGKSTSAAGLKPAYNFGGPERLSRVEMARKVSEVCKLPSTNILESSAKDFDRGVKSPLDTGMDSSRVEADLGIKMTSFSEGLAKIW